jgi:hypothetical protein
MIINAADHVALSSLRYRNVQRVNIVAARLSSRTKISRFAVRPTFDSFGRVNLCYSKAPQVDRIALRPSRREKRRLPPYLPFSLRLDTLSDFVDAVEIAQVGRMNGPCTTSRPPSKKKSRGLG